MIRDFIGDGHWLILQGFIAVFFGLATLVWPGVTLWILVLLWGVFATIDGLFAIGAVVIGNMERHRGWWALRGITGIAIGIITLLWPSITKRQTISFHKVEEGITKKIHDVLLVFNSKDKLKDLGKITEQAFNDLQSKLKECLI